MHLSEGIPGMAIPVYPSDLADAEGALLAPLLPLAKPGGRPRTVNLRRIVTGLFSLVRSGCAWRYLPRDYGPWSTVDPSFRRWRSDGTWERVHTPFRELARERAGRTPTPSAAIIARPIGEDAARWAAWLRWSQERLGTSWNVLGRKRHRLVDTLGLLLKVVVHPANLHDRLGAKVLLEALGRGFPRLHLIWAAHGDAGALRQWTPAHVGLTLEVVYPWWRLLKRYLPDLLADLGYQPGFNVIPRRWVVERTLSWLGRSRRLSRDYERLPISSEARIYITSIRLLLVRLV
jgi:putative transposase